jgi:hypothetical protein
MAQSRSGVAVIPNSSLKREGLTRSSRALKPNTVAPVAKTLRRYLMFSITFIMSETQQKLLLVSANFNL